MGIKFILVLSATILLSGCSMSPEEIKRAMDRCKDNDLKPVLVRSLWTYEVTNVVCYD